MCSVFLKMGQALTVRKTIKCVQSTSLLVPCFLRRRDIRAPIGSIGCLSSKEMGFWLCSIRINL
jgi:hypothetical protein